MGRLGATILILLLSATAIMLSLVLSNFPWFSEFSLIFKLAILGTGMFGAGMIIFMPIGTAFDKSVIQITAFLNSVTSNNSNSDQLLAPKGFEKLVELFTVAVKAARERENKLDEEVKDLTVTNHIIKTERDHLRGVTHVLRDSAIVTDCFDEIIMLNSAACAVFGKYDQQNGRQPLEKVISDRCLCQHIREVRAGAEFKESRTIELEIEQDGRSVAYQVNISCLEGNSGEVGAVVTILHDLTREHEIAEMKSEFVSKASHELRTPLSSIRAYVEMLVDGEAKNEEARQEFYGIIHNETERLSRMIDNMLNISRIEAGIIQIERENVEFKKLLDNATETLEPQAKNKRINVTVKAPQTDISCEGDPDMLYQVILNLLSNAIKYTPDGGRITMSADSDNLTRSIVVSVQDTGLGIPPDALPRLFEKFYRIETFKRVAEGTGLGLNLCRHIVETVHHGQIGVDSQLGMGSKFWFSIPMKFAGAQAA